MTDRNKFATWILNAIIVAAVTATIGSVLGWGGWITRRSVDHGEQISGIDSKLELIQEGVSDIQQTLKEKEENQ